MTSVRILFAASAAAVLLSACGGGGGDAGSPPPAAAVAITAANQQAVARATLDGGLALTRSQVLAADERAQQQSLRTDAAAQAALPTSPRGVVLSLAQRAMTYAFPEQRRVRADARVRPMAITTVTQDCSVGGSLVLSLDDRDNSQSLNANDTLTMSFAQCKEAADETVNGTILFTVTSATTSGDQFAATIAFQNVSMTFGQASTSVNGSAGVTYLTTSTSAQLNLTIGSSGLSASLSAPQYSDTVTYEPGLRIDSTENLTTPASSTASISGSFSSSAIGGRITVTTLQPVAQLHSDVYPYAGQIRVVGASSSALRITVLNATQVRIELDAGGDGAYEASTDLPWSTLSPE